MRGIGLIGCLLLFFPTEARAFRCTQVENAIGDAARPSVSWSNRSIQYTFQEQGTAQLPREATFEILRRSFQVWQNVQLDPNARLQCDAQYTTDISFIEAPTIDANWVGYDFLHPSINRNLIVFRDTSWVLNASDAADVIALTTLTYSGLTGIIIDADIEFNTAHFSFALDAPNEGQMDLQNTAVHEIGHLLGLAHCVEEAGASCGHEEVMEPSSGYAETVKRLLKCDDAAALQFKYPPNQPNGYCAAGDPTCPPTCAPPGRLNVTPKLLEVGHQTGRGCQANSEATGVSGLGLFCAFGLGRALRRGRAVGLKNLGRVGTRFLFFLPIIIAESCAAPICPNGSPSIDPNGPLILRMELVGGVPDDPFRALVLLDFVDRDGDLGGGEIFYFAGSQSTSVTTNSLAPIFSASAGVPLDARTGRLQVLLRLRADTPFGATLPVVAQLKDARGHLSNCYELELSLTAASRE